MIATFGDYIDSNNQEGYILFCSISYLLFWTFGAKGMGCLSSVNSVIFVGCQQRFTDGERLGHILSSGGVWATCHGVVFIVMTIKISKIAEDTLSPIEQALSELRLGSSLRIQINSQEIRGQSSYLAMWGSNAPSPKLVAHSSKTTGSSEHPSNEDHHEAFKMKGVEVNEIWRSYLTTWTIFKWK